MLQEASGTWQKDRSGNWFMAQDTPETSKERALPRTRWHKRDDNWVLLQDPDEGPAR
jgi:hypothetical protein